jgi:CDP-paratose 2-epimerase
MKTIIVTGSSGLIGSEAVIHFERQGYHIVGIDNNMRADFFGPQGDTMWNLRRVAAIASNFTCEAKDIRNRDAVFDIFQRYKPSAIIHCAAQPSHDLAAKRPFDDFEVNANGTLNLLEATRQYAKESPFIYMSTNKVYGDGPNRIALQETATRWVYADSNFKSGIPESFPVDQCLHSLFGVSKLAADLLVQEYGKYFNIPTVCFRGGCLTGPSHSGVELHGFLSYLVKCVIHQKKYTVFGYKGKQVRDQIHSVDVIGAFDQFLRKPAVAKVYNMGGGTINNASILECFKMIEDISGKKPDWNYVDQNRIGDHICYISDLSAFSKDYPDWHITRLLPDIMHEIIRNERD